MNDRAKNEPQSYSEMLVTANNRKSNHLYRSQTIEANDGKIKSIMAATTMQLETLSHYEHKLSFTNTEEIKQQSLIYMKACTDSGVTPTFTGLCRSFGYTRQAAERFINRNPGHATTEWLLIVRDAISEALADAALHGAVQPIVSIFVLKSRSGWKENDTPEMMDDSHLTDEESEELLEKYGYGLPD